MRWTRENFYGTCAIVLGVWEAAAMRGYVPKVTRVVRMRRQNQVLAVFWTIGLAKHFWDQDRK